MAQIALSIEEAYEHCRRVTRVRARNFYYAFVLLPRQKRRAIYAGYALSRELDDITDEVLDPREQVRLLAEVRRRLAGCYDGQPDGLVYVALRDAVQRYAIPRDYFEDLVSGVEMDLRVRRYRTFDDLKLYCYRVAGVVGLICIQVFGYRGPQSKEYAVDLGMAMQLTNILRDIKEDAGRGRIYLPQEEMERFGYREEDLFRGLTNDAFHQLMRFQVRRAREYFERGWRLLPLVEPDSRACPAVLHGLYSEVLRRIEVRGYDVFKERVNLSALTKVMLAARLWLRTRRMASESPAPS